MKRKIIKIDESKCTGCGECIPDCPEGALKIVNGKVRLVKEALCDGLGACVGRCPYGALTVEEREAEAFDEEQAKENMGQDRRDSALTEGAHGHGQGCPGMMVMQWDKTETRSSSSAGEEQASALRQWPIQLKLLNPRAPYFQNAELLVAADCVPFSFANFHGRFLQGKTLVIFCPKLDNAHQEYIEKLAMIFQHNEIRSVTVLHMEVPCCSATTHIVEQALERAGKRMVIKDYTISLQGKIA